jgi:hypothetical protein
LFIAPVITCAPPGASTTSGVAQLSISWRATFQSSLPDFRSSAAMNDSP